MRSSRKILGVALSVLAMAAFAADDANRDRGKAAAKSVLDSWGTPNSFGNMAMKPLGGESQMTTIDGKTSFGPSVSCPGSQQFMQLTLIPNGTGDIDNLAVDLDVDLDGTSDQHALIAGPFAAVCNNGMVRCQPGSMNGCTYGRWQASSSGVALNYNSATGGPNTIRDMGACYCFNNSCGSGLLLQNAKKILSDVGDGIGLAIQSTTPRFAISDMTQKDTTTGVFFGQKSSCGADQLPEQYYNNTGALEAKGAEDSGDPDSTYNKILASDTADGHGSQTQHCELNRVFNTQLKWSDVVTVGAQTSGGPEQNAGSVSSCGDGCVQILMGQVGDNYFKNLGHCALRSWSTAVQVGRPDLIDSVTIDQVGRDDWLRVKIDGAIVYNDSSSWTSASGYCGENHNRGTANVGVDVTSRFTSVAPGSTVSIVDDLSIDDDGEGWSYMTIRYRQQCDLSSESIEDGCKAQEERSDCTLRDEQVDGTQTVQGYQQTGLTPIASSKQVGSSCETPVTRDWFNKTRIYVCATTASPYDGSAAEQRYQSIHGSFDTSTGTYTDKTYSNGTYTTSAQQVTALPPPEPVQACPMVCKTAKPRPGVAVSENGPVSKDNPNGPAYDYTYHDCDENNVCPAEAGETVVEACACRNSFGEAAAAMQTIRMASQDALCQSQ